MFGGYKKKAYLCTSFTKSFILMDTTLTIESRCALSDEELAIELENATALDMNDYKPLTDEQYKSLVHSRPVTKNVTKWL